MLLNEQVERYREIYKKYYGTEISREKAYEDGIKLIRLIELIYKPMTQEEYNQLQERRKETRD